MTIIAYLIPPSSHFDLSPNRQILAASLRILNFHTSTNYQIEAPQPFTSEVHHDLVGNLHEIDQTQYSSDLDFHLAVSRSFKKLNDGHASYINYCYDGMCPLLRPPARV